jgi:outer membrane protein OmpA-like peptidoglycan-associated protein
MNAWSRFTTLTLVAGALACANTPPPSLVAARNDYHAAAGSTLVQTQAPVPLHEAKQALDRADRAFERDADDAEVEHLAYLASRRVEIAEELAKRSAAEHAAEQLGEERSAVLIDARTREADARAAEAQRARLTAEEERMRADALAQELADLQAKQTERGLVLTLGDVFFDVDRTELKPGAEHSLDRLVEFLRQHPDQQVVIEGHTDSTGSADYNLGLSERRADSVARFLEREGIERSRIQARGYGLERPIASNATVAGRQQNRRVEIVLVESGTTPPVSSAPPQMR